MQKILIILIFLLTSCGYQPLYSNKSSKELIFYEIETDGNKDISRRIISSTSIKKDKQNYDFEKLILKNEKNIIITSKNSKGEAESYKMILSVQIITQDKNKSISRQSFLEEFAYKNLDNKFDLSEYEITVENNLINKIVEKIIIYLNI
tara:strand:+ start:187 stop:633 length:447 start_codon:yes stop_codon:yes gene_type:complete